MRIALSSDSGAEGEISGHFGRSRFFIILDTAGRKVVGEEVLANPFRDEHKPGAVPALLISRKVALVITGGAGPMAFNALRSAGVRVIFASGKIREAARLFLEGKLEYSENECSH
jgi:predicted Fe-Mo cluster-binding NifX family protein